MDSTEVFFNKIKEGVRNKLCKQAQFKVVKDGNLFYLYTNIPSGNALYRIESSFTTDLLMDAACHDFFTNEAVEKIIALFKKATEETA